MKNIEIVDLKLHNNKSLGLFIEVILIALVAIFCVLTVFIKQFIIVLYFLLALTMFTMAYNNIKFFHKKYLTAIYIIVGVFIILSTILEII